MKSLYDRYHWNQSLATEKMQRASVSVLLCKPVLCLWEHWLKAVLWKAGRIQKERKDSGYHRSLTISWCNGKNMSFLYIVITNPHVRAGYMWIYRSISLCQDARGQVVQHQGPLPKVAQSCQCWRWANMNLCTNSCQRVLITHMTLYHWCTLYIILLHFHALSLSFSFWPQHLRSNSDCHEAARIRFAQVSAHAIWSKIGNKSLQNSLASTQTACIWNLRACYLIQNQEPSPQPLRSAMPHPELEHKIDAWLIILNV